MNLSFNLSRLYHLSLGLRTYFVDSHDGEQGSEFQCTLSKI